MKTISNLNKSLIEEILSEIQISEKKYEEAEGRYNAISEWLNRSESKVAKFTPKIYAQGSFLLGTAIKPVTKKDEHDVDIVCELNLSKHSISQSALKKMIGEEIIAYADTMGMDHKPSEGKRCWTLEYANGTRFHIDILPAIPDKRLLLELENNILVKTKWLETGIAITDRTHQNFNLITDEWPVSNPKGYFQWFKEQMIVQFETEFKALMEVYKGDVEKLPFYKIRTPLQYAIQLLKYHRDVRFETDSKNKPISIIITTLAAHAYDNEADLMDALINIVAKMRNYVLRDSDGKWKVVNPVNPNENFANKWNGRDGSKLVNNFSKWLTYIEKDFSFENLKKEIEPLYESYKESFGAGIMASALENVTSKKGELINKPVPNINISPRKPWSSMY